MAWIEYRPKGGGKLIRKRVTRTWLFRTIKAQQARLNDLEEALAVGKVVLDSEAVNSMPGATELAPSALPEPNPAPIGS